MTDALIGNAGDVEQVQKAKKKVEGRRHRELADLQALMKIQEGRRFVLRMITMSQLLMPKAGSEQGLQYLAGLGYIGAKIIEDLRRLDSAMMTAMLTEARREEKE